MTRASHRSADLQTCFWLCIVHSRCRQSALCLCFTDGLASTGSCGLLLQQNAVLQQRFRQVDSGTPGPSPGRRWCCHGRASARGWRRAAACQGQWCEAAGGPSACTSRTRSRPPQPTAAGCGTPAAAVVVSDTPAAAVRDAPQLAVCSG